MFGSVGVTREKIKVAVAVGVSDGV